MTEIVLDASAVAAWYLPTQATAAADALLAGFARHSFVAPHCFDYEVPNLMLKHERRGTLAAGDTETIVSDLRDVIRVKVRRPPDASIMLLAVTIARDYGTSLFDAFYVLLAKENGAALASRDDRQLAAANGEGCIFIDLRSLE